MILFRPKIIQPKDPVVLTSHMKTQQAIQILRSGSQLILSDCVQTGLTIVKKLQMIEEQGEVSYKERKERQHKFHMIAQNIIICIKKNKVQIQEKVAIPSLLKDLFPETEQKLYISLLDFQSLHQASQRYEAGLFFGVLGYKIHPFFAVYAPTRTSHLELFATWLQKYSGEKNCVYDIGVGSGILSFMLAKQGFGKIIATDSNPNAIQSVQRDIERLKEERGYLQNVIPKHGDLFGTETEKADVIVCNPPWMLGDVKSKLDEAMYFEDGFFDRFFEQAHLRLQPNGRLVLIFSNVIDLVTPEVGHPIQKELNEHRFTLVQKMQRRVKGTKVGQRKRRTKEKVEVWELKKQE